MHSSHKTNMDLADDEAFFSPGVAVSGPWSEARAVKLERWLISLWSLCVHMNF